MRGCPSRSRTYQQESGRAGRDGLEAECLLLYGAGDGAKWRRMIASDDGEAAAGAMAAIAAIERYACGVMCRHRALVAHFGQDLSSENCGACDVCLGELDYAPDPLVLAQKIVSCVARLEQRFGADYTSKVLAGSTDQRIVAARHDRLSTHGLLKDSALRDIRDWVEQLVAQGYLAKRGEYDQLAITPSGRELLRGQAQPRLLRPAVTGEERERGAKQPRQADWEGVDRGLFECLRGLRSTIAQEAGIPSYIVFGDDSLRDMARRRPTTPEGFRQVRGVGEKKLGDYGEIFLSRIDGYCELRGLARDVAPEPTEAPPTARAAPRAQQSRARAASLAIEHFQRGASVAETAAAIGRAKSTTMGYLAEYLREEQVIDPSPWVDSETQRQVEEAAAEVGSSPLKPIHDYLEGRVHYDSIRIVLTCLANREGP
jgi:ATP-dependent DNA helicase RecQ